MVPRVWKTWKRASALVLVPVVAACTAGGADRATERAGSKPAVVRDGIFDVSRTNDAKFRVRVDGVLRDAERTVLRVTVTNLESTAQIGIDRFGDSGSDYSFGGFRLLDPVGGRLYLGYRQGGAGGLGFGSRLKEITLQPGVGYEAVVYFFPPLPDSVTAVTVLSPGTTGEFSGVPVVAGSFTASPAATAGPAGSQEITALNSPRPPGATVALPAVEPPADAWSLAADVSGTVAEPDREVTTSRERRSVALLSDVLFPFGSAALTGKARTVIASAAQEITAGGDRGQPISVVGHTDGIGSDADNQALSERRARAVTAELRTDLGSGWKFTVSGKGESAPVAEERNPNGSDNPAGRARNRRVEITFTRAAAATPTGTATATTATTATAATAATAAFQGDDGPVVAEREGTSDSRSDAAGPVRFHLRVHPFRRDGGYLVAVFDLANVSGTTLDTSWGYFRSATYPGPAYASFAVVDPADGATYRTAYAMVDGVAQYLDGRPHSLSGSAPQRAFLYVPAPPAAVTAVTFDAGPFGRIPNVPIR
jgi:outer membrane protein OmpA-like peptidoglycan-associated protein